MNLNNELKNQSLKIRNIKKWEENYLNLSKENELLKSKQINNNMKN